MNNITAITERSLAGLQISKVAERQRFHNFLVYGKAGVGKTVLAGSADALPSMRPVLFVDVEGGTNSLVNVYPDVETVRIKTWKEMQNLYNVLADGKSGYKTVVLDSLTEIQKFNMYFVMEEAAQKRSNVEEDVPSQREWGISLEQIRRMVRGFRDLPMHTIFTALPKEDKNQRTGVLHYAPDLPGKLSGQIAAFLDEVFYYYIKAVPLEGGGSENVRLLLTSATDTTIAKDRSGLLPQVIQAPTMSSILELMSGKVANEGTETESDSAADGPASMLVDAAQEKETERESA